MASFGAVASPFIINSTKCDYYCAARLSWDKRIGGFEGGCTKTREIDGNYLCVCRSRDLCNSVDCTDEAFAEQPYYEPRRITKRPKQAGSLVNQGKN